MGVDVGAAAASRQTVFEASPSTFPWKTAFTKKQYEVVVEMLSTVRDFAAISDIFLADVAPRFLS